MRRTLLTLLLAMLPAAIGAQETGSPAASTLPSDVRRLVVSQWNGANEFRASDRAEIGSTSEVRGNVSVLRGPLTGQDGLRELLSRLQDRGLELIEVLCRTWRDALLVRAARTTLDSAGIVMAPTARNNPDAIVKRRPATSAPWRGPSPGRPRPPCGPPAARWLPRRT